MNPLLTLPDKKSISQRQFKSCFGVSSPEFDKLLSYFEPIWQAKKEELARQRWSKKQRKQKAGSGSKAKLPRASDCLVFVLYYLKQYPSFDALGAVFDMSGGQANRLLHYHCKTLIAALDAMQVLPKTSFEDVEAFQDFVQRNNLSQILIDATERVIQRPEDEQRQKDHYSGKKNDTLSKTQ